MQKTAHTLQNTFKVHRKTVFISVFSLCSAAHRAFHCFPLHRRELTADARELKGELYCLPCHDKMGVPICGACRRPIEGRVVNAMGKQWHVEVRERERACLCTQSYSHAKEIRGNMALIKQLAPSKKSQRF